MRGEHRHDEVHDVVVRLPRVVEAERLAPAREDHRDREAEVVEARQVDGASDEQGHARHEQVRHALHLAEDEEHERTDEESRPEQVQRIANGATPVA